VTYLSVTIKQSIYAIAMLTCLLFWHIGIAQATDVPVRHIRGQILTQKQVDDLLQQRVDGTIGYPEIDSEEQPMLTFERFAEFFACSSSPSAKGPFILMTGTSEVRQLPLHCQWSSDYKPTVREMLDIIAEDTCTQWKYVTESNARISPNLILRKNFLHGLVIFEFTGSAHSHPITLNIPSNWTSVDQCSSVIYMPPGWKKIGEGPLIVYVSVNSPRAADGHDQGIASVVPWGLKVEAMGSYSANSKAEETELLSRIPIDKSIELASYVHPGTTKDMLKRTTVGTYGAWYFESLVSPRKATERDGKLVWRQWVFMHTNKCYVLTSCIPKDVDDQIHPAINRMVESVRVTDTAE
jgi:hypothetical protein